MKSKYCCDSNLYDLYTSESDIKVTKTEHYKYQSGGNSALLVGISVAVIAIIVILVFLFYIFVIKKDKSKVSSLDDVENPQAVEAGAATVADSAKHMTGLTKSRASLNRYSPPTQFKHKKGYESSSSYSTSISSSLKNDF
ncbi:hypothetical protein TRFO_33567 [Tritrichomonas foetus]|uniref:Uncharacterized protein n=1 Tax=Tritrichomonas foetus TaxID=1144522 RepID=A0A1J4JQZ1_9EUKA|nr:hypothetical protein TRFO_33567 [Tritrichomonas foetus]|eukprot:OHS99923.1 hypothetical protein TRFO_33567 [Tritrichomonas foetus]